MIRSEPAMRPGVFRVLLAAVAIGFGLLTLVAGARVRGGADPGYVVLRPLLLFNTAMGVAYVTAGVTLLRSAAWGKRAAGTIFVLNLLALATVLAHYASSSGTVAGESLGAMTLRTAVWLALFLGTGRIDRVARTR
jgi:predicted anti-sigma-YlaC factor YlaD